jgi:hypothetical protein
MRQVVKTFIRSDQQRRVHIYQRDDGLFSFDEEWLFSISMRNFGLPIQDGFGSTPTLPFATLRARPNEKRWQQSLG